MRRPRIASGLIVSFAAMFGASMASASVLINYPNFCSSSGLTLVGSTATTPGCALQLTSNSSYEAGAAYSKTPVALGPNGTFSTTFKFQFTSPGGVDPADGIVFVLAANPAGLGANGGGLGYAGVANSIGIEFDIYNNGGADGNNSNHIAIDEDGHVADGSSQGDQDLTNVYGIQTCDFSSGHPYTASGCMSNGHIWTVTASYNGASLSLAIQDPTEGGREVIYNNLPIDISSLLGTNTAYVGFTAATGGGYENQDILSWQFANTATLASVPEPISTRLIAAGLLGLAIVGFLLRR